MKLCDGVSSVDEKFIEFKRIWGVDGMSADKIRLATAAFTNGRAAGIACITQACNVALEQAAELIENFSNCDEVVTFSHLSAAVRDMKESNFIIRIRCGDTEEADGMSAVYDPAYHKIKIGEFTICRMDEESVWIKRDSEEGGQFKDSLIEPVIAALWKENF